MNLLEMRQRRAEKVQQMRDLVEKVKNEGRANLTDEEQRTYDTLLKEVDELGRSIEREEQLQGLERDLEIRSGRAIYSEPGADNPGEDQRGGFRSFGDFVYTLAANPGDERLTNIRSRQQAQRRDMTVNSSGVGILIPKEFSNQILSIEQPEAIFRSRATVIPSGDVPDAALTVPALNQGSGKGLYAGVEVYWTGVEKPVPPSGDISILGIDLVPQEMAAYITVSDRLIRNAPAFGQLLMTLLRKAMIAKEDEAFFMGDGVKKPLGLMKSKASICIARKAAKQITYEDIAAMYAKAKLGGSLIWVANQTILPQLMMLTDPSGRLIWQPGATETAPGRLLGIPIVWNDRSPSLGEEGDLTLLDASYYLIKDGFGIYLSLSEHVKFLDNMTVIKAVYNVDGQPWLREPITMANKKDQISPFVILR